MTTDRYKWRSFDFNLGEIRQDVRLDPLEFQCGAFTWSGEGDRNDALDAAGMRLHDDDAIAQKHGFLHVMGDQDGGQPLVFPQPL